MPWPIGDWAKKAYAQVDQAVGGVLPGGAAPVSFGTWANQAYSSIDTGLGGILPGGAPPVTGSVNRIVGPAAGAWVRQAYTNIDTGLGGQLPGGAPPVQDSFTGVGDKTAAILFGPELPAFKYHIDESFHKLKDLPGNIVDEVKQALGIEGGHDNGANSAYISPLPDIKVNMYGSGKAGGGTPLLPTDGLPDLPRVSGGLRQTAVEMSGGWGRLMPNEPLANMGQSTTDRYGRKGFDEKPSWWDDFRQKYGFGLGMTAGFAASGLTAMVTKNPLLTASAFQAGQVLMDTVVGEPPYQPYEPRIEGTNTGFNYGTFGSGVGNMWGQSLTRPMSGRNGFAGSVRVRQSDVLRQFGRRLSNAEFRSVYGYTPRTGRRRVGGYARRGYGRYGGYRGYGRRGYR